jgi:hypothetical protein
MMEDPERAGAEVDIGSSIPPEGRVVNYLLGNELQPDRH